MMHPFVFCLAVATTIVKVMAVVLLLATALKVIKLAMMPIAAASTDVATPVTGVVSVETQMN